MSTITHSVAQIAALNENMNKSSPEQSIAVQQINRNFIEINNITNKLSESAQKSMSIAATYYKPQLCCKLCHRDLVVIHPLQIKRDRQRRQIQGWIYFKNDPSGEK